MAPCDAEYSEKQPIFALVMSNTHKAGFVSIVGRPNVGKSTLMNKLVGDNLSIITSKAQTTRHRIMGILNGADFQIVYSDTPGMLEPQYALHKAMMRYVSVSLEDADIVLLIVDPFQTFDPTLLGRFNNISASVLLVLNKTDLLTSKDKIEERLNYWKEHIKATAYFSVSALSGNGVSDLLNKIIEHLPLHPEFYPKDELTDRSERFFAAEIIREQIFEYYAQEIPYSSEVGIESFKEESEIIKIRAIIYIERDSQKGIIIGKSGRSLKTVGTKAREKLEIFFNKKVFLETHVKVADNWGRHQNKLKQFGYSDH